MKVKTDKYTTLLDSLSSFGGFVSLVQVSLATIGSFFLYKQFIMKITMDIHNKADDFDMKDCDYTKIYAILSAKGIVRTAQDVERLKL